MASLTAVAERTMLTPAKYVLVDVAGIFWLLCEDSALPI